MGGRWPANVIISPGMAEVLDVQSGVTAGSGTVKKSGTRALRDNPVYGKPNTTRNSPDDYGDSGGASRFFLTAGYEPWELEWIIANGLTPCGT